MRLFRKSLAVGSLCAAAVLLAAPSAQAACGQMDLGRSPDTWVWLNWSYGSTYTRVEPHCGAGTLMYAAIARYTGSGITYYLGPGKTNPCSYGDNRSYVSASNGTNAGNYYRWGSSGYAHFYNDYHYCKPGV